MLILLVLLTTGWTALYAQTGDSLKCYNNEDLKRITARVIRANECDTLLEIAEIQLLYKDSVITTHAAVIEHKDSIISLKDSIIFKHDDILFTKDQYIDDLNLALDKNERKLKWTKVGWLGTTVGLVVLWLSSVL